MPLLVQLTPRHGRAVADPCAAAPWTSYDRLEAHVARAQLNPQVGDLLEAPIDRLSHRVTGAWFIASLAGRRPLAYLLSQPLLEGRFRWPQCWDGLWARSPRFRRMWRVSSVLWGVGTLTDAALRVVMAYTLSPDLVPALGTALYADTSAMLIVTTTSYYAAAGIYTHGSALYRPPLDIAEAAHQQ